MGILQLQQPPCVLVCMRMWMLAASSARVQASGSLSQTGRITLATRIAASAARAVTGASHTRLTRRSVESMYIVYVFRSVCIWINFERRDRKKTSVLSLYLSPCTLSSLDTAWVSSGRARPRLETRGSTLERGRGPRQPTPRPAAVCGDCALWVCGFLSPFPKAQRLSFLRTRRHANHKIALHEHEDERFSLVLVV